MTARTYNPSVRVGNWNEDIQLEEDTLKDFLDKKAKGQLLIQQSASLSSSANAEVQLSVSRDGKVHFGDTITVVNPAPKDGSRTEFSLAGAASSEQQGQLAVTAVKSSGPTVRTSFVVVSCDGTNNGESLRYGQPFYLCTTDGRYFLFSDRATLQRSSKKSRNNLVCLMTEPSHLTQWVVKPFNPKFRLELEFSEVPANEKIILTHMKTNDNLNIEPAHSIRSPFGNELEVSSCTSLDSHRAENDTNHWRLTMRAPGDPTMDMSA